MPGANLPSNPQGWFVVLLASLVGFMAGFITITLFAGRAGG